MENFRPGLLAQEPLIQSAFVFRLEKLISESHLLIPKVNVLQRTGLKFKQRLARRCSDLEKAEAEVCISESLQWL